MLHNNGFVLIGGCGEEVEEGQVRALHPGDDDKVFRLDSLPVAACRAEEQKATPIPAGLPLRERFKEDEPFCFGRDYDAAHLKSNPKQMVSQIRVGRLAPGKEREDDTDSKFWWFNVKLDVSVTLRSNLKTTTIRYACTPREGDWDCRRRHESEAPVGLPRPQLPTRARPWRRDHAPQPPFRPADRPTNARRRRRGQQFAQPAADPQRRPYIPPDADAGPPMPAMRTRCFDVMLCSPAV